MKKNTKVRVPLLKVAGKDYTKTLFSQTIDGNDIAKAEKHYAAILKSSIEKTILKNQGEIRVKETLHLRADGKGTFTTPSWFLEEEAKDEKKPKSFFKQNGITEKMPAKTYIPNRADVIGFTSEPTEAQQTFAELSANQQFIYRGGVTEEELYKLYLDPKRGLNYKEARERASVEIKQLDALKGKKLYGIGAVAGFIPQGRMRGYRPKNLGLDFHANKSLRTKLFVGSKRLWALDQPNMGGTTIGVILGIKPLVQAAGAYTERGEYNKKFPYILLDRTKEWMTDKGGSMSPVFEKKLYGASKKVFMLIPYQAGMSTIVVAKENKDDPSILETLKESGVSHTNDEWTKLFSWFLNDQRELESIFLLRELISTAAQRADKLRVEYPSLHGGNHWFVRASNDYEGQPWEVTLSDEAAKVLSDVRGTKVKSIRIHAPLPNSDAKQASYLANFCHGIESDIMIGIGTEIMKEGYPFMAVHDAYYSTRDAHDRIQELAAKWYGLLYDEGPKLLAKYIAGSGNMSYDLVLKQIMDIRARNEAIWGKMDRAKIEASRFLEED